MEPIGPYYRPPPLPGKGWVLVAAGGCRLVPGERYELAVRGAGLTGEPDFLSALCDGPRSFQGIEWGAVLAFRATRASLDSQGVLRAATH